MPSARAHLLNGVLRLLVKRRLQRQPFDYNAVTESRSRLDRLGSRKPLPQGYLHDTSLTLAGCPAEMITPPLAEPGRTLLYLHGGAYLLGSAKAYRPLLWRLAEATGARVIAINYRLAPEHPYPAATDDALAVYRQVLDDGVAATDMVIAGDSAGGNLTLVTLLRIRAAGLPQPAGAVAISPWADLTGSGGSHRSNARRDAMLPVSKLADAVQAYLRGKVVGRASPDDTSSAIATDPLVSPVFADFSNLAPLLLHVGSTEILRDDALRVREAVEAAGGQVELRLWHALPHVFHLFADLLPDAEQAISEIGFWTRRIWRRAAATPTAPRSSLRRVA